MTSAVADAVRGLLAETANVIQYPQMYAVDDRVRSQSPILSGLQPMLVPRRALQERPISR